MQWGNKSLLNFLIPSEPGHLFVNPKQHSGALWGSVCGVEIHLQEWLPPNAFGIGGAVSGVAFWLGRSVSVRGWAAHTP